MIVFAAFCIGAAIGVAVGIVTTVVVTEKDVADLRAEVKEWRDTALVTRDHHEKVSALFR